MGKYKNTTNCNQGCYSLLIDALKLEESTGEIIEIGGEDILTYKDLMSIYAEVRGLKRYFIKVPVLTPKLSSHWVGFVTPLPVELQNL